MVNIRFTLHSKEKLSRLVKIGVTGQVHHAEEYSQLIINYDENNRLVEIEVLNASKFFGGLLTEMIQAKPEVKLVEIGVLGV